MYYLLTLVDRNRVLQLYTTSSVRAHTWSYMHAGYVGRIHLHVNRERLRVSKYRRHFVQYVASVHDHIALSSICTVGTYVAVLIL
jgi:hypothetical protein